MYTVILLTLQLILQCFNDYIYDIFTKYILQLLCGIFLLCVGCFLFLYVFEIKILKVMHYFIVFFSRNHEFKKNVRRKKDILNFRCPKRISYAYDVFELLLLPFY